LVTTYLSCKNVVYDEKLSLCLLTKATNLLMFNSVEEIENLQSQVHIEDLFHITITNVGTFRDWHVPKSLVRPKTDLSYSHSGIVRNLGHVPSSQH
jgi:hypothetical protein